MFCENCGNPIAQDAKFCVKCGMRVTGQEAPEEPVSKEAAAEEIVPSAEVEVQETAMPAETATPAETAPPTEEAAAPVSVMEPVADEAEAFVANAPLVEDEKPAKRKGGFKKKAIIAGIVAASLTVTTTLAALFVPEVGNFLAKTFLPADKYFAYVQKNNAKNLAEDIASLASVLSESQGMPTGGSVNVEYEIGEGLYDLLRAEEPEAAAMISWIKNIGVKMDIESGNNVYAANLAYLVNGSNFVSAEGTLDLNAGYVYVAVPELFNETLRVPLPTELRVTDADLERAQQLLGSVKKIIPEEKVLKSVLTRYIKAISGAVKDVTKKSETLKAGGVSQKVTCLEVKVSEKLGMNVLEAILKEVKKDKELKGIIENVADVSGEFGSPFDADEVWDNIVEGADELLDDIEDADPSSKSLGKLKFWVNGKGEIVGFGMSADGEEIKCYTVSKGDKDGFCFNMDAAGQKAVFEGSSDAAGGKRNGSYTLTVKDAEMVTFTLSDVDDAKLKDEGIFSGKLVIEPSASVSGLLDMAGGDAAKYLKGAKIEITSNAVSQNEGNAEIAVHLAGKHFFSVKATSSLKYGESSVNIPSSYIDTRYGWDPEEKLNKDAIISALERVGAPSDLVQELRDEMEGTEANEEELGGMMMEMEMPASLRYSLP